jgi:hypothetical protein
MGGVVMPTITVKNIPPDLYQRLKQSAEANRRSINSEVIVCIEKAVCSRKLQPESVDETFQVIAGFAGVGSQVVFDYVRASALRGAGSAYGEREIVKLVAKAGERWCFGLEDGELAPFLQKYGLSVMEHQTAQDLERLYFTGASGAVVGRVNGTHCLVRAAKPGGG